IMQIGSARPDKPVARTNLINPGGGSDANALVVPKGEQTNYNAFFKSATQTFNKNGASHCYYRGNCVVAPYDSQRGNAYFDMDARVAKNLKFGEKYNLQLAFQAFNLTNHANYGNNFGNVVGDPTFGHPTGFINPTSSTLPRAFIGEFGA